jgi:hypothetical protein
MNTFIYQSFIGILECLFSLKKQLTRAPPEGESRQYGHPYGETYQYR